ncbi:noncanonical pyrimidine nucleotidase, YjjG family [Lutibacter sp. HS1-25]|uniref:YjjG family noncanonical pyrimidine nucleotidase n=1 Tax=Lutibacter sp. HS1-25 TaxID=2485000 RepID=UPI001011CADA|nr:YjjG family noncanonical pyrimidine nucleotidase [Lutibacter sp. HS1-25]RXP63280.1 noncanonical pyrimidine nucleotidase, YjjG family [Lutibacter sp. HS1-25]
MNHINHIFFDLDHTLWDFETNSDIAFEAIFKKYGVNANMDKFLNYYRGINEKYWKLYRDEKVTQEELRVGRLKDTFTKIKYQVDLQLIDNLSVDYIEYLPKNNQLFEGTFEILEHLKPKYKMHIITNGFNEVQFKKIENSGLTTYFDKIITSESVGVKKPNPIIFQYALDQAKATSSESIMIGDNWEADIMGAKNAGLDVIFCNFNNESVSANIKSVKNLLELKQYL